jgi:hypothetical protein
MLRACEFPRYCVRVKTLTLLLLAVGFVIPAPARAQQTSPVPPATAGGFVMVIAGSQTIPTSRTSSEFQLFGRTGTVQTLQRRTTGPLIDLAAGHTIFNHLALGLAVVRMSKKQLMSYDARVPVAGSEFQIFPTSDLLRDAEDKETQVHFSALWIAPFNNKVSIDFSGGPSVFFVKRDVITAMTTRAFPVVSKLSDTATGYHAGFALRARLVKNAGLGFRIRYAHATADLPPGIDKVGGLQIGAGLTLVF